MAKPSRGGKRGPQWAKEEIDRKYGTYYQTLFHKGPIKYVQSTDGLASVPLETRTPGRTYGLIDANGRLKSISFYDQNGMLRKTIDIIGRAHRIKGSPKLPHVHYGYPHDSGGTSEPTSQDALIIDIAKRFWYNRLSSK